MYKSSIWIAAIYALISIIVFFGILAYPIYGGLSKETKREIDEKFLYSGNQLFENQLTFRERLIEKYKSNLIRYYKTTSFDTSLFNNYIRNKTDILFLLPQEIQKFEIPIDYENKNSLTSFDTLKLTIAVDIVKVNSILDKLKPSPVEFVDALKYQDIVKIDTDVKFHLKKVGTVIYVAVSLFLIALIFFALAEKSEINDKTKNLSHSIVLKFIDLIRNQFWKGEIVQDFGPKLSLEDVKKLYSSRLLNFESQVEAIKEKNSVYFLIENLANKAEIKCKQINNRSHLMLIAGLLMAFIGIVVFYVALPTNISEVTNLPKIISLAIRPTLMLIFIESISWYLLKQYRALVRDYNYFYSIFNRKQNILAAYKLLEQIDSVNPEKKYLIPLALLADKQFVKEEEGPEMDNQSIAIMNTIIESLFKK
jgi:hypothetical protein